MSNTDESRWSKIVNLPDGIRVSHAPNPCAASSGGRSDSAYSWEYETTVQTVAAHDIRVVEFGCFIFLDGKPVFANYTHEPFTSADFAEWYSCPDAVLRPGQAFTDPVNWSGYDELNDWEMTWYFVGRDANENTIKGLSKVTLESRLAE